MATDDTRNKALQIRNTLLANYGHPVWRNPLSPLEELVSTILSQNTNDVNRDRAFDGLIKSFPSWESVRDAPQDKVIEAIRIAGLANQKGPRIQKVLSQITNECGDLSIDFLRDMSAEDARSWLMRFKGVGPKTAAIVLLFSLDLYAFPVDTHVYRVSGRLGLLPDKMSVEAAHVHLEQVFLEQHYYDVHLNVIRLGREVCHARKPECLICPIRQHCSYWKDEREV
ncbi:MAG: Fe-S cluster assembly protein HesB [Anaerolineaceae bacterium]|nr:Fe-S cluster assembly protein HesB [Anaerolineaceae bacterium]